MLTALSPALRTAHPDRTQREKKGTPQTGFPFFASDDSLEEVYTVERGDQERGSDRQNGVELREGGQNQRLTHHVVAVADGSDTVGADLRLEDRRSQVDDAYSKYQMPQKQGQHPFSA